MKVVSQKSDTDRPLRTHPNKRQSICKPQVVSDSYKRRRRLSVKCKVLEDNIPLDSSPLEVQSRWQRQQNWQQSPRPEWDSMDQASSVRAAGLSRLRATEIMHNQDVAGRFGTQRLNLQNRRLQVRFLSHLPLD
jgi:hypothetical protein